MFPFMLMVAPRFAKTHTDVVLVSVALRSFMDAGVLRLRKRRSFEIIALINWRYLTRASMDACGRNSHGT